VTRFGETLIQFLVTQGENRGTIYLKRDTSLGKFFCLFKLKTILKKKGYESWKAKCDFDIQRRLGGRFLHPFISSCMF